MNLAPGTRLGAYEIVAPIGKGGMGEVYRARDTKLDRDVAIKVLPARLVEDDKAHQRFEREAKAVAALSHPNILSIHDFGTQQTVDPETGADTRIAYAVTELLEGETLAERIAEGPMPVRKALDLAGQMAEGLAAAHERGLVHRDIKPANLFLTTDGRLKILDFGLAKEFIAPGQGPADGATMGATATVAAGRKPTAENPATDPGIVMGTAGYMSPEQVRGHEVDSRSDIFAFGTVLHEMLTDTRPFRRDSAVETMSAILREDPPDTSTLNPSVSPALDRIIRRCLEKQPSERFQSARDLAFALGNTAGDSSSRGMPALDAALAPAKTGPSGPAAWVIGVAGVLVGVALGWILFANSGGGEPAPVVKVTTLTHTGTDVAPSVSPDGRTVAFASARDGTERIYLRQMEGGAEIAVTEGPDSRPKFSPDGNTILFIRDEGPVTSLYRVATLGGQPRKLREGVSDADWSPDGEEIVVGTMRPNETDNEGVMFIRNARTGDERELAVFPGRFVYGISWSPDGKWIAGVSATQVLNTPDDHIVLVDTESGGITHLPTDRVRISGPAWNPSSTRLVFARSSSLLGDISNPLGPVVSLNPFTLESRELFYANSVWAGGSYYVSFDYRDETSVVYDEILWREHLSEGSLTEADPLVREDRITGGNSRDRQPAYSPDGSTIIFSSNRSGNLDLWTIDRETGSVRQVTDDSAEDWDPAFTADGKGILWSSSRGGHLEIWAANADGSGARQLSDDGADAENPTQTPDGEWVVYASGHPDKNGIWKIRTDGSDAVRFIPGAHLLPETSPDGRFVAYITNHPQESRTTVSVSDFATGEPVFTTDADFLGLQAVLSVGRVRWMPDGSALVFVVVAENGRTRLAVQDFVPGRDTRATRRHLTDYDPDSDVESFGLSPDGERITVARIEYFQALKLAEGLPVLD